jgi:hypothetical protein
MLAGLLRVGAGLAEQRIASGSQLVERLAGCRVPRVRERAVGSVDAEGEAGDVMVDLAPRQCEVAQLR